MNLLCSFDILISPFLVIAAKRNTVLFMSKFGRLIRYFIILIGELDYYGQFGFEVNTNMYFSLNVRKEKILLKKLSVSHFCNTFFIIFLYV